MAMSDPVSATNLNQYGDTLLPWQRITEALAVTYPDPPGAESPGTHTVLGTVRPDGKPHAATVGAVWLDGRWYLVSGPQTQKSRNIAALPACTLSAKLPGYDVIFRGDAERVTDAAELERVAAYYRAIGWPATVEGQAFTAPFTAHSGGPPPWNVYRIALQEAVAEGTSMETTGATRWRFA